MFAVLIYSWNFKKILPQALLFSGITEGYKVCLNVNSPKFNDDGN